MHPAGDEYRAHAGGAGAGDVGADAVADGQQLRLVGAAGLQLLQDARTSAS